MISTCSMGKIFLWQRGGHFFFLQTRGGVNKVSCRRGDLDFTLQEGGNNTLPPHAHVWSAPVWDVFWTILVSVQRPWEVLLCWDKNVTKKTCTWGRSNYEVCTWPVFHLLPTVLLFLNRYSHQCGGNRSFTVSQLTRRKFFGDTWSCFEMGPSFTPWRRLKIACKDIHWNWSDVSHLPVIYCYPVMLLVFTRVQGLTQTSLCTVRFKLEEVVGKAMLC